MDKKTLIKIGISAGSIIVFLIIYYAILNPIVNKKKAQLTTMLEKQEETAKFISEIKSKKRKIKKLTPQYEKYSTLFHSKAEVEGLYQTLSEFADQNNLIKYCTPTGNSPTNLRKNLHFQPAVLFENFPVGNFSGYGKNSPNFQPAVLSELRTQSAGWWGGGVLCRF